VWECRFGRSRAQWLLLGPDVALQSTPYDLREAAKRIRAANPQAEDFARNSVLNPPSERAMLEGFSRAELK